MRLHDYTSLLALQGEDGQWAWLQFSSPIRWHYDVLRALEYFRSVGDKPDSRMGEAIDLLQSKQQPDGGWLLENTHPGKVHFALENGDGRPSRGTHCGRCVFCVGMTTQRGSGDGTKLTPVRWNGSMSDAENQKGRTASETRPAARLGAGVDPCGYRPLKHCLIADDHGLAPDSGIWLSIPAWADAA
jgi:hypothetical protein